VLQNTGTTSWSWFSLTGPPGTVFLGGATAIEQTVPCVVGPPEEIVCGPISAAGLAPGGMVSFVGTLHAAVGCGASFAFAISATGVQPFTPVAPATFAGSCEPPALVAPAKLRRAGTRAVVATAPVWSETPAEVAYRWQRCARTCSPIRGASTLRLSVQAGESVRLVAVATFPDGESLRSVSARLKT